MTPLQSPLEIDWAAVAEWYRYRVVACLVTSSSPVPLKTRRVGQRCTLNLSRAETSSRWSGTPIKADKSILEFVQSSKNINDADSNNENEMNNAAPYPTSSEIRNIMKSMRSYSEAHFNSEMNNKMADIEQFDAKKRQCKEKDQILKSKFSDNFPKTQ
ncbi:histone-lysine N-methyltransferase SETMAR [Trichonephila clavipes]|nr:histone-lysine N-methyltransferase SETMAR [Trichonephila clavipes]